MLANHCVGDADNPVFEIPELNDIVFDGKIDDWDDRGFHVDVLTDEAGRVRPTRNFDARARLGWDKRGLLVLMIIKDDVPIEFPWRDHLLRGDAVEIFLADRVGSPNQYEVIVSPGAVPQYPDLRHYVYDKRVQAKAPVTFSSAAQTFDAGYVIEMRLPWTNLEIRPAEGSQFAFQMYAIDADRLFEGNPFTIMWHHHGFAYSDTRGMYCLELSKRASPPVQTTARGRFDEDQGTIINVVGVGDLSERKLYSCLYRRKGDRRRPAGEGRRALSSDVCHTTNATRSAVGPVHGISGR